MHNSDKQTTIEPDYKKILQIKFKKDNQLVTQVNGENSGDQRGWGKKKAKHHHLVTLHVGQRPGRNSPFSMNFRHLGYIFLKWQAGKYD